MSKNHNNKFLYIGLIIISVILLSSTYPFSSLKKATITGTGICDFTIKSIDEVKTLSNEPTLNNEKVYLIDVAANKGSECLKVTLTQDDFTKFGITDVLYDNITLSAEVQDLSLDYKVEDDTILYKIYESTASADLSEDIPYSSVSLKTTQLSALGKFSDPNGQAPPINHLGNFPSGGDVNLMRDVTKIAYAMREASNIPFGADKTGNWWVTHLGGVPFYRGYRIDTMAYNKYRVLFTLEKGNEILASTTVDEQNRIAALGDIARIKFVGSSIDAVFPPQPSRYYYVVQGLDGTPVKNQWKFVSSERYEKYKTSLDSLVNVDPDYFAYSYSDMDGTLIINSTPTPVDVYIDNKYIGFTPITIDEVLIGRHIITAKKVGFFDAEEEINLNPTVNKLSIVLAKIPPPEVSISLAPQEITQGQSSTLSWSTKGEVSTVKFLSPEPQIVGTLGSQVVNPQTSTTYTLIASGVGGDKIGSARLQVNPPPPPPPPPPPRRDPADSKAIIAIYENELNNMLGLMYAENIAPRDCIFDKDALVVTCRPQLPVSYPEFQIILKASAVSMQINSGKPEITSINVPDTIYQGDYTQALVTFKNVGTVADIFDVSLQSIPSLSGGTQQFSLAPQQSTTASIPFSGVEGMYKAKIVVQSRNNPLAKSSADVEIKILKKPLPDEIKKLEKQTDFLEDLISQGYSRTIQIIAGIVLLIGIALFIYKKKKR